MDNVFVYIIMFCLLTDQHLHWCTEVEVVLDQVGRGHRCQPSRNRAGNPAFWFIIWFISRIPAFLRERPAFLALFRNNKNR